MAARRSQTSNKRIAAAAGLPFPVGIARRPARFAWLLLLLPALTPLLRSGFFVSDDGRFHVYRIAALADAWREGVLHPRLFPEFGFGYGQAALNYYSPLSYWPGALLSTLGMSPAVAFQWTVGLGFVLAALAAYAYVRSLGGHTAGVLAALVYTYLPYHLADAYTRGALPEHFAFVFPPLILWAYSRYFLPQRGEEVKAHRGTDVTQRRSGAGAQGKTQLNPSESAQSASSAFYPLTLLQKPSFSPRSSPFPGVIHRSKTRFLAFSQGSHPLLLGALAWAGLVLTHNLTTLLMALAFIPYLLLLALVTRRWDRLVGAGLSLLLAMGLSAGYWLPVLAESGAVGIGVGPSQGFVNHLLAPANLLVDTLVYPYRDASGQALVYPLSWLAPLLLVVGAIYLMQRGKEAKRQRGRGLTQRRGDAKAQGENPRESAQSASSAFYSLSVFHLALALVAIGMTTTLALPLWLPLTPLLGHLQYPWRFLLPAAVGLMGCAALLPRLLPRVPGWLWAVGLTGLLAVVSLPGLPLEPLDLPAAQVWSPQRMWQEDAETGQVGATWTGEFLPVTVTEQRWALGRAREGATDGPPLSPAPTVRIESVGHSHLQLAVESAIPFDLRLHRFAQPGWTGTIDGAPVPVTATGEMGLATVGVEAGNRRVAFVYGPTPARRAGAGLALLAVAVWSLLAWRVGWRVAATFLAAGSLLLALNGLGLGQRTRAPLPVQAQLGDTARLVGFETSPARGERALDVTLYWFALRETGANLNAFVHLLGADGGVISQHDGAPVGGFTPTSRWRAGEVIADTHRMPLPPEIGLGNYALKAGLYDPATVTNLPVEPPTPDERVELGQVEIGW